MSVDPITSGIVVGAVAPLGKGIVEKHILSKVDEWLTSAATKKKVIGHTLVGKFEDYIERMYVKHTFVKTIALKEQKTKLSNIYVSLTLKTSVFSEVEGKNKSISYEIGDDPFSFVDDFNKCLIIDSAGMGKSTIVKHLF